MSSCVHFAIDDDESAQKVGALLEGLGYEARRDLAQLEGDVFAEAAAAAARRFRLTDRERQTLEALLRGHTRQEMAELLRVSASTVKWRLHSVYTKLGVNDSEAALRKTLLLDDPRWLCAPLRQRDALERVVDVAEHVVHVGKTDRKTRLDHALTRLEDELEAVRRDAALAYSDDIVTGDDQVALADMNDNQLELLAGDDEPTPEPTS